MREKSKIFTDSYLQERQNIHLKRRVAEDEAAGNPLPACYDDHQQAVDVRRPEPSFMTR